MDSILIKHPNLLTPLWILPSRTQTLEYGKVSNTSRVCSLIFYNEIVWFVRCYYYKGHIHKCEYFRSRMLYGKFLESKKCLTLQETNDQNPYEIVLISDTYQSPSDAWRTSGNVNVIFPVIIVVIECVYLATSSPLCFKCLASSPRLGTHMRLSRELLRKHIHRGLTPDILNLFTWYSWNILAIVRLRITVCHASRFFLYRNFVWPVFITQI